jgi:hypothetical protein
MRADSDARQEVPDDWRQAKSMSDVSEKECCAEAAREGDDEP